MEMASGKTTKTCPNFKEKKKQQEKKIKERTRREPCRSHLCEFMWRKQEARLCVTALSWRQVSFLFYI